MEVTVSSMFTTTPRRKPCEGQVPTPTIFSFPSRSNSPTRTQIFVVPTSMPTITRSCTIYAPIGRYNCETHYKHGGRALFSDRPTAFPLDICQDPLERVRSLYSPTGGDRS